MKKIQKLQLVILLLFSLLMLIPVSPAIELTPPRDSGIFLYAGSQFLEGHALYSGIWDHKLLLFLLLCVRSIIFQIIFLGCLDTGAYFSDPYYQFGISHHQKWIQWSGLFLG